MKNRFLIVTTILALGLSSALRAEEPKTVLGDKMDEVKKSYDAAKKQINGTTESAETLALVSKAKATLEASLKEKPKNLPLIADAKKDEFLKGYEAEMKKMIELFGKLEASLTAKTHDASVALVKEIDALQRSAHGAYRAKPKA